MQRVEAAEAAEGETEGAGERGEYELQNIHISEHNTIIC